MPQRQRLGPIQPHIEWIPRVFFTGGKESGGLKLATHLYLVLGSRMVELYLLSNIRLHGVVLN
jgi:hypothetical protein